ncbi:calpain-type cysteine protease DEK1 isoform X3 [Manihot esculenta]|uniref:calpain-type cysteine protease DEK1 isoform X3 n=1 Tax=Manihot esculenta TaxID=3983 RepID=UPI000B5D5A39|nr:calpain-type cysteine protease DEK1 isoform X3 [Manihot esculenta]
MAVNWRPWRIYRVEEGRGDLTGDAGEEIDMRSSQAQIDLASGRLWLLRFKQEGFLLGAGSPSGSDVHISSSGIVQGHAYSLLQVREVDGHKLVQIHNPWANEVEWNGPWSDSSPEWTDRMKHKLKDDPQSDLVFIKSQKMVSSGCLGKTSRSTSDCILFMANGEATVLVVAKIMLLGMKIHSFG